jgi:hypothetical protein
VKRIMVDEPWIGRVARDLARESIYDAGDIVDLLSHIALAPEPVATRIARVVIALATAEGIRELRITRRIHDGDSFGASVEWLIKQVVLTYGGGFYSRQIDPTTLIGYGEG